MLKRDPSTSAPPPEPFAHTEQKQSPVMAQYSAIRAQNPGSLLFYRMGDFYELFFEDAEIAARALGIVLTRRGKQEGRDIPMCGVPVERASSTALNRVFDSQNPNPSLKILAGVTASVTALLLRCWPRLSKIFAF